MQVFKDSLVSIKLAAGLSATLRRLALHVCILAPAMAFIITLIFNVALSVPLISVLVLALSSKIEVFYIILIFCIVFYNIDMASFQNKNYIHVIISSINGYQSVCRFNILSLSK